MQDYFGQLYGQDPFSDSRNYDTAGNFKPRKLVVRDHEAEASTRRQGFVRGYVLTDTSTAKDARADAAEAYEHKRAHLRDAWRNKEQAANTPAQPQDARSTADAAYEAKKQRLQGGWKQR
jgi:hypothetical protein